MFPEAPLPSFRDLDTCHIAIHRLRMNKPLTPSDLEALESMLAENGIGDAETIARAREESQGLGLFVRSLIGLDRGAAKEAFADFLEGQHAHRESDRVHRPHHQPPHRAWGHGCSAPATSPPSRISPRTARMICSPRTRSIVSSRFWIMSGLRRRSLSGSSKSGKALSGDSTDVLEAVITYPELFWSGRRDSNPRPSPWQYYVARSIYLHFYK